MLLLFSSKRHTQNDEWRGDKTSLLIKMIIMPKKCNNINCNYNRFGGGYCKNHQYLRTDKKPKPLKPFSEKRKERNAIYLKKRIEFLNGKICPITNRPATEIHHMNGRENERLNDEKFWLAVTREGHKKIHLNPIWARENGYLI